MGRTVSRLGLQSPLSSLELQKPLQQGALFRPWLSRPGLALPTWPGCGLALIFWRPRAVLVMLLAWPWTGSVF